MSDPTVVILGAGQAGFQAAASLRERGFSGRVLLAGDEHDLLYPRPPLSKAMLTDRIDAKTPLLRPPAFYEANKIELLLGETATAIDRAARKVQFASGATTAYDHLILALGARNRRLALP